ncbi:MAG: hypothetical protein MJ162_06925 [Treponema sp.]|nr:hypothetical protein [Treponema sp.]
MKLVFKHLYVYLSIVFVLAGLAGCANEGHVHIFDTEWTSDENYHWHSATCDDTLNVKGRAKHSFGEWTTLKEATEETEGSKERTCSVCGYKAVEKIEKLAHVHTFEEEWTNNEDYHWHAASCDDTLKVSGKAKHSFGEWTILKEATEETEGLKERSCSVCGYKVVEKIEKLAHVHTFEEAWTNNEEYHWHKPTCDDTLNISGKAVHSFEDGKILIAATESAEGLKEIICSVCGYKSEAKVEKLPHSYATEWTSDETNHWHAANCAHPELVSDIAGHLFGDWVITVNPTEDAEGTKEKTCLVCGYKASAKVEKLPHTFADGWTNDETDHWHAATCAHTSLVTDKAGHSFGSWVVAVNPTEDAEGTKEKTCSVCGYKVEEKIAKLPHSYATEWTNDESYHWHAATCAHHDLVSEKAGHSFGAWVVVVKSTEDAEGTKERTCSVCGYRAEEKIDKLPHTYAADWTSDESYHWHAATCAHHDLVSEKAGHSFSAWVETVASTEDAEGTKEKTCSVCGYKVEEKIEKLPHSYAAEWTSDETNHWHAATCAHPELRSEYEAHVWDGGKITKNPTATSTGILLYTCTTCKRTKEITIPKLTVLNITISIAAGSDISVVKTDTADGIKLTADVGYDTYEWSSLGRVLSIKNQLDLRTVDYSAGTYVFDLLAVKKGEYYSASVTVTFKKSSN